MKIEHLDDVLPHVRDRQDFVVAERDGYTVVDYIFATADTFDHPARVECRGIKFGRDGRVIARPFAKFFNIGEKEHTQPYVLDFTAPHVITEKLDGSMVHPAIVGARVVFMTRMGHTDTAKRAERHLDNRFARICRDALSDGLTPIFEWTAPDNRIVIRYETSALTLLAVRETVSGDYLSVGDVGYWARRLGVEQVRELSSEWSNGTEFLAFARAVTGSEGFVLRFSNGLWVKAKGEDYVTKHKAKDGIGREKNALAVVLQDGVDDVLPLLSPEDAADLIRYRDAVMGGVAATAGLIRASVASGAHLDQKTFATKHLECVDHPALRSLAFQVRAGADPFEAVRSVILKSTGTSTRVEAVRPLFGARWEERATIEDAS